ncbi:MAG: peptidylprolyl isomerase [Bacteroidaceae bacterium]|nr:peptidylprolyl isomerase [Bacteroidaceae bacterium]
MKKTILVAMAAIASLSAVAQTEDPVLMRVNGKAVTRGEFEYEFNKNNSDGAVEGTTVKEYLPMFINYKLKVEAAYEAKYDTLSGYKKEFRQYRDQLIRPMLVTDDDVERQTREYYDKVLVAQIGEKGLCTAAHIFVAARQNATEEEVAKAKVRIDSIYDAFKAGADFAELARKHSEDGSASNGGNLGTFGPGQMIQPFEDIAYGLADGAVSEPFKTSFGWHIVKTIEHKPLDSFETLHDQIKTFLERQHVRERLAATITDSLARTRGVSMDELMDQECDRISASDSETRFLVKEYREGLLLFEICDKEVWGPAKEDTAGQEAYFKKHKKDYTWTSPKYMGAVLQAIDSQALAEAEQMLKGEKDHSKWIDLVKERMNKDSVRVRIDYRLFSQGDNKWVDYIVFKGEKQPTASKKYPCVNCVGKVLKKKAERWIDVRSQVQQDYQRQCENAWVETLKQKYAVWVDEKVLETVNKH